MVIKKIEFSGAEPKRQHPTDGGYDLVASDGPVGILPGEWALVKTETAINVPENHVGMVCSRSGLAAKFGIHVLNAPGIIDAGYTGEIGVILHNVSAQPFIVATGDRIAQLILTRVEHPVFVEVEEFGDTQRAGNGFGSTGV